MSQNFETFTESGVEADFLKWLSDDGWEVYGEGDKWGSEILDNRYGRDRNEVIYWNVLKEKVIELNDHITEDNVERFLSSLKRDLSHENLIQANKKFHKIMRGGKRGFQYQAEDGSQKTKAVDLIDFQDTDNNRFIAVNQFRVRQGNGTKRPDINLFVNGIPLVTMELKSVTQENDYYDAIEDIQEYEEDISRLFVPALFNVASDSMEFRYGSVNATNEFYNPWKPDENTGGIPVKQAVEDLLTQDKLLDILHNFVFFEEKAGGDAKITPRHMQYQASNRILKRIDTEESNRGLIWHTQGSGKSYTMLYTAKNLITRDILDNPQIVVLVDREKLESQMSNTLDSIDFDQYDVAKSGEHLQDLLQNGTSTLILTTIQKFQTVENDSQGNPETVVLTDEAHRFMEKDLGSKLDAVLPDTYHFGFTGTPVRDSERDTFNHYGPEDELYLHRYSIKEGIQDNLILPVVFTPRNEMEWEIDEDQLDVEFEQNFSSLDTEEKHEVIKNNVTTREIAELKPRVNAVTENIYEHFQSVDKNGFKGLVVTPSQKAAALYGERLQSLLSEEEVEVFVSAGEDSDDIVKQYKTTKEERDSIVEDYKKEDKPKIIVVCDMLLTGFDAPVLKTMYLDRNLKNHSLLQAIARTNRIKECKNNGEIVDYQGVFQNLDKALDYSEEVRESAAINKDEMFNGSDEVQGFKPLLEDLITIFDGIEKSDSLEPLNKAVSRLRKNPDDRKKFKEGMRKLQDLYETLSPDKRLKQEEIAPKYKWLTQVRIAFETDEDGGRDNSEDNIREKTKEILEENVEITDIKEEFSSYKLSEEHLEEIENLEPNIKATKIITATHNHLDVHRGENPRYKRISERLNEVIERWQSEEVTDIEAVDKLEEIEREMIELEEAPEEHSMKDYEYAFYTALTDNYSDYLSEEEAEGVARKLGEQFREKIDTDFENWYENEKVRKEFGKVIVEILLKEFDKKDLYLDNRETLIEDFWDYAVENTVKAE
jgi:type I restriction enzyme R subunit